MKPIPRRYSQWIAVVVLVADIIGVAWGWCVARDYEFQSDRDRFRQSVHEVRHEIDERMLDHELILRGGVGLFAAGDRVTRQQWRDYVKTLKLEDIFPGIQGLGFAEIVRPQDRQIFTASVRAEGYPEFRIWPEGDREIYTAIKYLEPFARRNLRAFGYDMYQESARREAMDLARDSGVPVISGKVRLVQETETGVQNGILMYFPVYRSGATVNTVDDRRKAIVGWVYSPYRMHDLMHGILGTSISNVKVAIYDGERADSSAFLVDIQAENADTAESAARTAESMTMAMNVYGRNWTVRVMTTPSFYAESDRSRSTLVLIVGLAISLLVGGHIVYENIQAAKLAEHARQYRLLFDDNPHPMWIFDPESLMIVEVNHAAIRRYGHSRGEFLKLSMKDIRPAEDVPAFLNQIKSFQIDADGARSMRMPGARHLSKDGAVMDVESVFSRTQFHGRDAVHVQVNDVTLRRQLEERDRQSAGREKSLQERLHHADRMSALGTFVAGIAHEINNPLSGILNYAELIRTAPDIESSRRDAGEIMKQAERCARIVEKLLSFSRKRDSKREIADLGPILQNCLNICSYQMSLASITVVYRPAHRLPAVLVDRGEIEQVFINILNNALDAMKDSIESRTITVWSDSGPEKARIAFQDTGTGIHPDVLPKIFDPFFTTKEIGRGTGLGLSISYGIIADHGGMLSVKSERGRGSTFVVELPAAHPAESNGDHPASNPAAVPCQPETGSHILVVDDDPCVRQSLSRILEMMGHTVSQAESVDRAIERLGEWPCELLIVDMRMPGKDGAAFYDYVSRHRPDLVCRFVLTTGDVMSPEPNDFVARTGVRAIQKPFRSHQLAEVIREVMESRTPAA